MVSSVVSPKPLVSQRQSTQRWFRLTMLCREFSVYRYTWQSTEAGSGQPGSGSKRRRDQASQDQDQDQDEDEDQGQDQHSEDKDCEDPSYAVYLMQEVDRPLESKISRCIHFQLISFDKSKTWRKHYIIIWDWGPARRDEHL